MASNMKSTVNSWENEGRRWTINGTAARNIEKLSELKELCDSLKQEINATNAKNFGSIGTPKLAVTDSQISKLDNPFAMAMGTVAEDLYAINPKQYTVTKSVWWGQREVSLFDLVKDEIDDRSFKQQFEGEYKDLQEKPSESFNQAMLAALLISLDEGISIDEVSQDDKDKMADYFDEVYRSQSWQEKIDLGLDPYHKPDIHNVIIDVLNYQDGHIGPGIYVNGQGRDPYKSCKFGSLGNFADNGCMAMAVYNANISLGRFEGMANIEQYVQDNGGDVLFGKAGGDPLVAQRYFIEAGYQVNDISGLWNSQQDLEEFVRDANGPTITLYGWNNGKSLFDGFRMGAHYVMIEYDETNPEKPYLIYNLSNNSDEPARRANLDDEIVFEQIKP